MKCFERWLHTTLRAVAYRALMRPPNDWFWGRVIGGDYLVRIKFPRVRCGLSVRPMLHHFLRSDDDRDHHNHPFRWSISLILAGGYTEERVLPDGRVRTRRFRPGMWNVIRQNDFHRITLETAEHGCWTLFLAGHRVADWGFRDAVSGLFIPHTRWAWWKALSAREQDAIRAAGGALEFDLA